MDLRLGVVLVFADDFPRLLAFYRDSLGLPLVEADAGAGYATGADWAQFDAGGGTLIELFDRARHGEWLDVATPRRNALVIGFRTEGIERLAEELDARGVELDGEISHADWGSSVYFRDPEGNLLQVYELAHTE